MTHISEQLLLDLKMPWGGISPRFLTRGAELYSFTAQGTGRPDPVRIEAVQLELFPKGTPYGS